MKTRYKIIIGIIVACLAAAAGIWMEVRTGRQMREALELALEQNRNGIPFTSDTIVLASDTTQRIPLRRVAAYYNAPLRRFLSRHSSFFTLNSSLIKSLYALGCVYRDLHEAPIAIITWEEAVAAADTTADDCDYATLYRVYGQMADMYMWQHLPEKELEAQLKMSHYSFLAGDSLNAIRGQLLCNSAYYTLGDTAAIFANSEAVRQQYLKLGLTQEAARVYPTPIHVVVENGQYERARRMMDEYERNSGLFGEDGFILDSTRVQYHYYKGLYYLGLHQIDSAELQFRKLLLDSIHFIDACRGLFTLYQEKHGADSAFKYGHLYEEAMGRYLDNQNGDAIIQAQAMYDYKRNERFAQQKQEKLTLLYRALAGGITIVVILIVLTYQYARRKQKNKESEIKSLMDDYAQTEENRRQLEEELILLNNNLQSTLESKLLLQKKNQELSIQLEKLRKYEELARKQKVSDMVDLLKEEEIIKIFTSISVPAWKVTEGKKHKIDSRVPSEDEWTSFYEVYRHYLPNYYGFIERSLKKSTQEFKVALLSRIDFSNKTISALLSTSSSRISNIKENINEKLFKQKGSKSLVFNLKHY